MTKCIYTIFRNTHFKQNQLITIKTVVGVHGPFLFRPTGGGHQSRPVSRHSPGPERGLRLAGGGNPVWLLGGRQHPGLVDLAPPAECRRRRHLAVLPCAPVSNVSTCENTADRCYTCREFIWENIRILDIMLIQGILFTEEKKKPLERFGKVT